MASRHDKATIISMTAVALALATSLHEGVGHGLVAWLRGDTLTELTSNHLSSAPPDRWVDSGGTLVNLAVGFASLMLSVASGRHAHRRFFLWILGGLNLLSGAGYFLFSGVLGAGDWGQVIEGIPHYAAVRVTMAVFGAGLYVTVVRAIAIALHPFVAERVEYSMLARVPYLIACAVDCLAGAFDPLGLHLFLISTTPAVFGGFSGLLWADVFLPRFAVQEPLTVRRSPTWCVTALVITLLFVALLGRGIEFQH